MKKSTRIQLAQDLHDGIAQDLVGVGYSIDSILATPDTPVDIRAELRSLRFDITDLLEKLRTEIYSLRSSSTSEALVLLEDEIRTLAGSKLRTCEIEEIHTPPVHVENICKIALELVRNCVAHSGATHIDIRLWRDETAIMLEVADNGVGGVIEKPARYGVSGLYERSSHIGGELEIKSTSSGTRATLRISG